MTAGFACIALWPLSVACVTKGTYDRVSAERDELDGTRVRLERRVEQLEVANQSLINERDQLLDEFEDQRIVAGQLEVDVRRLSNTKERLARNLEQTNALLAQREAEIAAMRGTYDELVEDLQAEVSAGQIEIERLSSGLNLNLSQEVLFGSGSAAVSGSGAGVLRKVASRLSEMHYQIEVVGHTDDVPVSTRYPSNWELAAARASSVVRLLSGAGVDPARLTAVSRGEYEPVASNDTAEGRARNRRIEIRLTPMTDRPEPPERGARAAGSPASEPVAPGAGSASEAGSAPGP